MLAQIAERLHEQMHKLPGMPSHSKAERLNRNLGARCLSAHGHYPGSHPVLDGPHPVLQNRNAHNARPPRVLVAWQEWIGRLFAGKRNQR